MLDNKWILFILYVLLGVSLQAEELMKCNGFTELCGKRYNEIAYIESHNATSTIDSHAIIPHAPSVVQNQDLSLDAQLNLGIRVLEFHVHFDYINPLGYYTDMLKVIVVDNNIQLNNALNRVKTAHSSDFAKISDATSKVNAWQASIDDIGRQIDDINKKWDRLPTISVTEKSKASEGIKKTGLQAQQKTYQGLKEVALGVLKAAQSVWDALLEADPEISKLRAQLVLANTALQITTAGGIGATQQIFVCHGLSKADLYKTLKSPEDLLKNAPQPVKTILTPLVQKLMDIYKEALQSGFGETPQEGVSGNFPYPACLIDSARRTLEGLLGQLKQWLDTHPNEVLTLEIKDFAYNNEALAQPFIKSGILTYAYAQDKNKVWPTLAELIKANKRLIIFKGNPIDEKYPWMNRERDFYSLNTKFGYNSPDQIIKEGPGLENILTDSALATFKQSPISTAQSMNNKLFRFTHNITIGLAGNKNAATKVNAKKVFLPRLVKIAKELNHAPNFASLDFVEVPNQEAFDAINEFNGVGKYAIKLAWRPKAVST